MDLLNIGFMGDVSLGEKIFTDIAESAHSVNFFSEITAGNECFDLVVMSDNCQHTINLLQKYAKNIILVASSISNVVDSYIIKNNTNLCVYFISNKKPGYLCRYTTDKELHEHESNTDWLREQINDITISLSRGEEPEPSFVPYYMNEKFYTETPERIRRLISVLLQRLGDQSGGTCVSNFAYHTWLADTEFLTIPMEQGLIDDLYACHFFFNETGEAKRSKYVKTHVMITVLSQDAGSLVTVSGDDSRFQRFTQYLDTLQQASVDPVYAPIVAEDGELVQLSSFNNTHNDALLQHDVITLFRHMASQFPQSMALYTNECCYSYGELDIASDKMACWLLGRSTKNSQVVAVSLQKSVLLLIVLLGILKSNKTYVLLDPQAPAERNQRILDDAQPSLILAETPFLAKNTPCVCPVDIDYEKMQVDSQMLPIPVNGLAYICYTSGTTGIPKGVMITRAGLSNVAQNHRDFIGLKPGSRVLSIASLGFDAFGWDVFGAFVSGATVYLASNTLHNNVKALHHYLVKHRVEHATLTPAVLELLPRESWDELRSLIVMGDAPPENVITWWSTQTRLFNGYGPTEATIATSLCEYTEGVSWNCIGKPLHNYRCYILDKNNNLLPIGFEGELCIAGIGLASGYLNQPLLTNDKFVTFRMSGSYHDERIYKTGDVAKWDGLGNIIFIGRRDNQIKIRGIRIETGEVEAAIRNHQQVVSVCVLAKGQDSDKKLVAFVQTMSSNISEAILRDSLVSLLHPAAIPSVFVFLASLPLSSNGKIDRHQLENFPLEDIARDFVKAETKTESILERIVAKAIDCIHVDVTQDFISLGAHSLTMSRIVALIARDLDCRLSIADIFQRNTVRKLAGFIDEQNTVTRQIVVISQERQGPLSPQQHLLWFLSALNPDDCSYNLPIAIEIRGALDLELFEDAINFIYEKHESLRTQFGDLQGVAYQYANPHTPINLRDHYIDAQHESVDAMVKRLCAIPFDIIKHPPVVLRLVKYGDSHHVLIWIKHNIITDAWSEKLILNDLCQYYNNVNYQTELSISSSTIQTIDFANMLKDRSSEDDITYWQQQLKGCEELDFPLDKSRPMLPDHAGEVVHYYFDSVSTDLLAAKAKENGVTPFVLLLSALNYLLSKYTHQQDIVIGTAIAARDDVESAQVSGFHVNTVPLRTVLSADDSIANLIEKTAATCINAWRHQYLSFDKILHLIEQERVPNKNPLFQIMAILQNTGDRCQTNLNGCTLQRLPVVSGFSMFDMTWNFSLEENGLAVELHFSSELFNFESMRMMLDNYEQILNELLTLPVLTPLTLVNPLCKAEQRWLLSQASNLNSSVRKTLLDQIQTLAHTRPNNIAVSCDHNQYNYGQLWAASEYIAQALHALDSEVFSVGIMMEKSCRVAALILGVLRAGKHYVPIDVHYPAERIRYMIDNASMKVLVTDDEARSLQCGVTQIPFSKLAIPPNSPVKLESPEDNSLSYIMYTSGSTGNPKGVMVTYGNLNNFTNSLADTLTLSMKDKILSLTSISFDIFGLELFCSLVSGAHVVLCSRETIMDPVKLYHFILQQQPTIIQATPTVWGTIVNHLPASSDGMLTVLCGGEKMPSALLGPLRRISNRVLQVYGPTETTIWSTCVDLTNTGDSACIGKPINMTDAYIMNDQGCLVPSGAYGELCLGGAGVSPGYWNNPELSAKSFVYREVFGIERYLYRTGDIVRLNRQGLLEYVGRNDLQVKIRGHRIELSEIDLKLSSLDNIEKSLSLIMGEGHQASIISYVKLTSGSELNESVVRAKLKELLPNIMIPAGFVVLSDFPLTNNNKIDVRKLPLPKITRSLSELDYVHPSNGMECTMQSIWQRVLEQDQISVTDSYFSLGGNSLQIPQLLHLIYQEMGVLITIRDFIMHNHIRELVLLIQSGDSGVSHDIH